jgi:hypothetical protein
MSQSSSGSSSKELSELLFLVCRAHRWWGHIEAASHTCPNRLQNMLICWNCILWLGVSPLYNEDKLRQAAFMICIRIVLAAL